jgi:hypothetical protein
MTETNAFLAYTQHHQGKRGGLNHAEFRFHLVHQLLRQASALRAGVSLSIGRNLRGSRAALKRRMKAIEPPESLRGHQRAAGTEDLKLCDICRREYTRVGCTCGIRRCCEESGRHCWMVHIERVLLERKEMLNWQE